jgi:TolB-like protein
LADIFVSYSREDKAKVTDLVDRLSATGWTVWCDTHLAGGAVFSEEIEREINEAKVVLVVWSEASVKSKWVADEAEMGRDAGKLVPISIDGSMPPIGFRQYQSIDFSGQGGEASKASFAALLSSCEPLLDRGARDVPLPPAVKDQGKFEFTPGILLGGAAVVLALVVGAFFIIGGNQSEVADKSEATQISSEESNRAVDIPVPGFGGRGAIAVLPFANLSQNSEDDHIGDGITEDVLTSLQSWGTFKVISRSSTLAYKDKAVDIPTVASTLGARYILEGSVRRAGDRIRVTAQLIDAETDSHLWAENYDRKMVDVFAIQDDISEQIAISIAPEINRSETRRVASIHPADLTTWEMTMRAQSLTLVGHYDSAIAAKKMLEEALERDPNYALAHVRLAELGHDLGEYYWQHQTVEASDAYHAEALAHARKAVELNPTLVEARIWLGHLLLHNRQVAQGVLQLREGVKINPSHGQMRAEYGFGLTMSGEPEQALEELELALKLSPNDPRIDRITIFQALTHHYAGSYEMAAKGARGMIDSRRGSQLMVFAYLVEVSSYVQLEELEKARISADEFKTDFGLVNWTMIERGAWTEEQINLVERDLRLMGMVAE